MKKYAIYFCFICLSLFSCAVSNEKEGIQWITLEEAQALNKENPKKIFIDVYTDWCGPCKKMASKTFTNPKVIEYVNKNFYAVKFNGESQEPLTFNGNEFKNNGRTHEFTHYLGVTGYPTMAFFAPDNSPIMKFTAYMNADELLRVLHFINEEAYKKKSFDDYEME